MSIYIYIIFYKKIYYINLVRVREATHATHYAKDIVVCCVNSYLSSICIANRVAGKDKLKGSIIDSTHIACATGLVLLRLKAEGVDVNTSRRYVGVMLVWLYQVKVASVTLGEAVVAVKG